MSPNWNPGKRHPIATCTTRKREFGTLSKHLLSIGENSAGYGR